MDQLLYGHNPEERIVAVHQKDDSTMRLFFRNGDAVTFRDEPFYPFLFLANAAYLEGFRKKHWLKRLEGNGVYEFICAFEDWPSMWEAIRYMLVAYNRDSVTKVESYTDLDFLYFYTDPVTQYLLQSGRTLFKGMRFDELHRLQIDIETYTSGGHPFSNAKREGDRIILIAMADSSGWSHLIDGKKLDERQMLKELVRIITERNPDVIEGHNIYGFDLPYILKRCELHGLQFAIGRDGSPARHYESSSTERPFESSLTEIAGRHVIDTLLLLQSYDTSKRDLESYGLKYAAKYFGIASPERTYISGDKISWHWDHDVQPLMDYALDDVIETQKLSDLLSGSTFYLTQMLPLGYSQVARMGSAAKIECLMVREYVHRRQAMPKPASGAQTTGGYTDIFFVGVTGPVLHVDVESLYPSIMLSKEIAPKTDTLSVFPSLLQQLTQLRLKTKRSMKAATEPLEAARLDAMQSSLKILINSFYGYLGYGRALFNDYAMADVVTQTGQELLRSMIAFIRSAGGRVIEVDTDGVFFVPPDTSRGEEAEIAFVEQLSRQMPKGISVALDGRYRKMMSYKKKNYALLGYDDRIKIRGSSLTSRSMERYGRHFIQQCIDCLLNNNISGLHTLYAQLHRNITEHRISVKDFARIETLRDSPAEYQRDVEGGRRNKSAAYEVAIASGKQYKVGDKIAYYITGSDRNARSFDNCKPAEEWDPNFPDENTQYYLRRLDEFAEKFAEFFLPQDFRAVFSPEGLFPFSPIGITLVSKDVVNFAQEGTSDTKPEPTIWLDES